MRSKPFSLELSEATTLKDVDILVKEITVLLTKLLNLDRRTLKKQDDKLIYNGRVALYSNLYKQCREKFITLKKTNNSVYYKEPLSFEDFLDKINYQKGVRISVYEDDDDDDLEIDVLILQEIEEPIIQISEKDKQRKSVETYTTPNNLLNEYLTQLQIIMSDNRKIFRRDDPEVIKSALYKSLSEFLHKFEPETSHEVLKKVYHDIRTKATTKSTNIVQERVGEELTDEELKPLSPVGANSVQQEVVEEMELEMSFESQSQPTEKEKVKTPKIKEPRTVTISEGISDNLNFDILTKGKQDEIVINILLGVEGVDISTIKAKFVKNELIAKGYLGVNYDNSYYSLERVKKQLK